MTPNLAGKIALVTGASRGIGRAIAVALAKAGAAVVCTSTRTGGCAETLAAIRAQFGEYSPGGDSAGCDSAGSAAPGRAEPMAVACDVASQEQIDQLVKAVLERHQRIDILVNNAGITRDGMFLRMPNDAFDQVIGTNLRGPFLLTRAVARAMRKAGGRIVNIGSIVGSTGNAYQANYAASKAGLVGLTKSLAQELAESRITVNVVAPGFITTDMTAAIPADQRQKMLDRIPLRRFGAPEDVAAAVVFLCSDSANYITGQTLVVDGGMTM
jgi:3-oxoacyl-[acyl-carrier protein] reductase